MSKRPRPSADDWPLASVIEALKERGSEKNRAGLTRFGIDASNAFGVPMAELRPLARQIGRDEQRALALWESGYHEARLLAILTIPPEALTDDQAWAWLAGIQSWDLCDQLTNILAKRSGSEDLIAPLSAEEGEFLRRAAYALIAWRSVHAKKSPDEEFLGYFPLIKTGATDPRNFVWKAVHWALRQIGKRSASLHGPALQLSKDLLDAPDKPSQRVGREAFRELDSSKVRARLGLPEAP